MAHVRVTPWLLAGDAADATAGRVRAGEFFGSGFEAEVEKGVLKDSKDSRRVDKIKDRYRNDKYGYQVE